MDLAVISIVALNGGTYTKFLSDFLDSVLPQLTGGHELVLDDWNANENHSTMINRAIARANGEWILQVGSDDLLVPGSIKAFEDAIECDPGYDVYYGNLKFFGERNELCVPRKDICLADFRINNQVYISSLFRKQAWEAVGGFWGSSTFAEDWDFWMRLMKAGFKFKYIDKTIIEYRVHPEQAWVTMCTHFEEMREVINRRMDE